MPRTYTLTYESVTPESAEDGDCFDRGFGHGDGYRDNIGSTSMLEIEANYPHGSPEWREQYDAARRAATDTIEPDAYDLDDHAGDESAAAVALMVGLIKRHYGATEPSDSAGGVGTWYTTPDGATDYRTGAVVRVSVHLDGWTPTEQAAIYAAVARR